MAKKKSYPKAPSAKAGIDTLKAYEKRCQEVKKFNDAIDKEADAKKKIRDNVKKLKSK